MHDNQKDGEMMELVREEKPRQKHFVSQFINKRMAKFEKKKRAMLK